MLAAGHKLKRPCCSAMWCGAVCVARRCDQRKIRKALGAIRKILEIRGILALSCLHFY